MRDDTEDGCWDGVARGVRDGLLFTGALIVVVGLGRIINRLDKIAAAIERAHPAVEAGK